MDEIQLGKLSLDVFGDGLYCLAFREPDKVVPPLSVHLPIGVRNCQKLLDYVLGISSLRFDLFYLAVKLLNLPLLFLQPLYNAGIPLFEGCNVRESFDVADVSLENGVVCVTEDAELLLVPKDEFGLLEGQSVKIVIIREQFLS